MYYQHLGDSKLGFDPFIAPDDFDEKDPSQYGGDHPINIYEVVKREYALNNQARYIYYYSDGNYPLTLTPTESEYYLVGSSSVSTGQENANILVNTTTYPSGYTAFGETTTNKRWVVVYRPSTAKFSLSFDIVRAEWYYCSNLIYKFSTTLATDTVIYVKYIHMANINSITDMNSSLFYGLRGSSLTGRLTIPMTVS